MPVLMRDSHIRPNMNMYSLVSAVPPDPEIVVGAHSVKAQLSNDAASLVTDLGHPVRLCPQFAAEMAGQGPDSIQARAMQNASVAEQLGVAQLRASRRCQRQARQPGAGAGWAGPSALQQAGSWMFSEISGRPRKLACEIRNRLRIDLALVPLLKDGEIRASGLPILAALPAVTGEIVRGGCQHIGRATQQIAAAIAVEIDREFDVGRGHELGLAELAGPGATHFGR